MLRTPHRRPARPARQAREFLPEVHQGQVLIALDTTAHRAAYIGIFKYQELYYFDTFFDS